VLNESRKRGGMKKKIEMKQAALFVNPNESRKSTKVKKTHGSNRSGSNLGKYSIRVKNPY
jgi:hypothetical protein